MLSIYYPQINILCTYVPATLQHLQQSPFIQSTKQLGYKNCRMAVSEIHLFKLTDHDVTTDLLAIKTYKRWQRQQSESEVPNNGHTRDRQSTKRPLEYKAGRQYSIHYIALTTDFRCRMSEN